MLTISLTTGAVLLLASLAQASPVKRRQDFSGDYKITFCKDSYFGPDCVFNGVPLYKCFNNPYPDGAHTIIPQEGIAVQMHSDFCRGDLAHYVGKPIENPGDLNVTDDRATAGYYQLLLM